MAKAVVTIEVTYDLNKDIDLDTLRDLLEDVEADLDYNAEGGNFSRTARTTGLRITD